MFPTIVGIVNVTGDSFSEGPLSAPSSGVERAVAMAAAGADIIEFGAESTRPGAPAVDATVELERICSVVRGFTERCPGVPFAVDTRRSRVAKTALELGAKYIGDVSCLRYDPALASMVASSDAELVVCHSRGTPDDMDSAKWGDYGDDPVATISSELEAAIATAVRHGVRRERIVVDPGFGFAKSIDLQYEMLRRIGEFKRLGRVFAGVSRKSFLSKVCGGDVRPDERRGATVAAELLLARGGVDCIRTHEPRMLRQALRLIDEVK